MKDKYIIKKISDSGHRVTSQKKSVLDIFQKSKGPLTLKDVENSLIKQKIKINKSTIYRIIESFIDLKILIHSQCKTNHTYDLLNRSDKHTIQLICTDCGKTHESKISKKNMDSVFIKLDFQQISGFTTAYGICNRCG